MSKSNTTVILGSGVIGLSIAHYIYELDPNHQVILVDSASELFNCASGQGAGFITRTWFSSRLSPLAQLSFGLHCSLAAAYSGTKNWGFSLARAWNITTTSSATDLHIPPNQQAAPENLKPWLRGLSAAHQISFPNESASIDPHAFCQFLLRHAQSLGASMYNPYRLTSIVLADPATGFRYRGLLTYVQAPSSFELAIERHDDIEIFFDNLVFACGPWVNSAFSHLFPEATSTPNIVPVSGYSITCRLNGASGGDNAKDDGGDASTRPVEEPSALVSSPSTLSSPDSTYSADMLPNSITAHNPDSVGASCTSDILFPSMTDDLPWSPELHVRTNGDIYICGRYTYGFYTSPPGSPISPLVNDSVREQIPPITDPNFCALVDASRKFIGPGADIVKRSVCVRPIRPGGVPYIGKIPPAIAMGFDNIYISAGHGPWGISLAPGSGLALAELIVKGAITCIDDATPFQV
ncbi:hypothetical protein CANCADRAFT_122841 [Tortispora caseinolytica NRRL Y-17796]|uniref:FAD dependent oxidoreductase domain-containing protein n=1 Tax=Tortispora caseinolytica NRRL Y-17796 TaxID=767744 RepID=A0A1E4THV2_9ASCO|nr:hypothetical protein CANCADRAFT_122841 [Tortispora caseinolytica NRRL Y-17796]